MSGAHAEPVRLLLIDNYDSFTYNLVQAFLIEGATVDVRRNDAVTVEEALAVAPTHVCVSPGPGTPHDAGISPCSASASDTSRSPRPLVARWCVPVD
jgi:anthranilate/para-aminobenzoate synthase component II